MKKSDLVVAVAKSTGLTKAKSKATVEVALESIKTALGKGSKVKLVGLGTFSTADRKARKGKNPFTGETVQIKAKTVVKFKPSQKLKDLVNAKQSGK